MTLEAVSNAALTRIRVAVPEFEDAFQEELPDEDGELRAFQAMSLFARWVAERVRETGADDATRCAFQAIEDLIADPQIELGDALAAEFVEALWSDPGVVELMGTRTRARALGGAR